MRFGRILRSLAIALLPFAGGVAHAAPASPPQADELVAPMGTTAISGQILTADGTPLANILLTDGPAAIAQTDEHGRFLLKYPPPGASVMRIDGRHGGAERTVDYGTYEVQVKAAPHRTTPLPFISWLTPIDHSRDVVLPSPTNKEVVLTTPEMPGFELRIPPGTVITDWDGNRVNKVSLTALRPDRPPFPLPRLTSFPMYFTAQPGGAKLWTVAGERAGARVIYPNHGSGPPGSRTTFWHYQPHGVGWLPYGTATVSADGKQVVPDPGVTIYDFMGGGSNIDDESPDAAQGTNDCGLGCSSSGGEPVDLASGFFTNSTTDLAVDDVIPISVTRSYMSSDQHYRDFGFGMSLSYEMHLTYTSQPMSQIYAGINLVTPTTTIPFTNATPSYGNFDNSIFVENSFPGPFYDAQGIWNGNGFQFTRRDGTAYAFGYQTKLQYIQDRFGNRATISYQQVGTSATPSNNYVAQVASPNGRFVNFTYMQIPPTQSIDGAAHYVIKQAQDNLGRTVKYVYDTCGRIQNIYDAHATAYSTEKSTQFTWFPATCANALTYGFSGIASITDANGHLVVQNTYVSPSMSIPWCSTISKFYTGRVAQQVLAGSNPNPIYNFQYTLDTNGNILTTAVTDPRGYVHQVDFTLPGQTATAPAPSCTTGFPSDETWANGTTIAQTWTYSRNPAFQLTGVTAPVLAGETKGRLTQFLYDTTGKGNIVEVIQNSTLNGSAPTPSNVTTRITYSPTFNQVATITDPNGNETTFVRPEPLEEATQIQDANTADAPTNITYTSNGQVATVSRAASTSQTIETIYAHDLGGIGDLTQVTQVLSPSNRTWTVYTDPVGRPIQRVDPLGALATTSYDPVFGPLGTTDANGNLTQFTYDLVGNLITVEDPKGNTTTYQYDVRNRLAAFIDPLNYGLQNPVEATYNYDLNSNLICAVDRTGNQANFVYDQLNRPSTVAYYGTNTGCVGHPTNPSSGVSYKFDNGNRLTSLVDSLGGTTTRGFDDLDRLISDEQATAASVALGTVSYTYDAGSRRTGMTTANTSPQLTYSYSYDNANNLLSIVQGTSAVCMTYDTADRRQALVMPGGITATYSFDAASDLLSLPYTAGGTYTPGPPATCTPGTTSLTATLTYGYDQAGRQTSRGGSLFTLVQPANFASTAFNADNQLTEFSGTYNFYDANGNLLCQGSSSQTSCNGPQTYTWDPRNRLTMVTNETSQESYTYDGLARRQIVGVTRAGGSANTYYLYEGQNVVQSATTGAITDQLSVINGLGLDERFFLSDASSGNAAVATDSQGSTVALYTGTTLTDSYSYPAFGGLGNGTQTYTNAFRYTGREASDNTSLYYYRGRYYSPTASRFISEDPLGVAAGANLYAYVGNDPLNEIDPYGLQAIPPDAMVHILSAHGINTLRTRAGNSVFNAEYSNPANLQQLSNDVFASPLAPAVPFYGNMMAIQGQVLLQNTTTGATVPYVIGTDANGNPTNTVQIRYDPTTGNVVTMFPVPSATPCK